jgi:mannose-6-phosphate isomerase
MQATNCEELMSRTAGVIGGAGDSDPCLQVCYIETAAGQTRRERWIHGSLLTETLVEDRKILLASPGQFAHPAIAPFRIDPLFVKRVWGYPDLRPWYDEIAKAGEPIGEVWLTGDKCVIATGPHARQTLGDLFKEHPQALFGAAGSLSESPLLIKVIFAKEKLSVQVHPDDRMARKYGQPRGKTECWYVLAADPGARVAVGLNPGVTLGKIREAIDAGTLEESLNSLAVHAGEVILVDAGTVHAIWPGSILLEAQQNSDVTYRMFDYGRPRELHIDRSLEAIKLTTGGGPVKPQMLKDRTVLIDGEYFSLERLRMDGGRRSRSLMRADEQEPRLAYLFAAAGSGWISGKGFEAVALPARGIVAVPAISPDFVVEGLAGLDLIRITAKTSL